MNQRPKDAVGSDYWRACAANDTLSDSLQGMMTAWFAQRDISTANPAFNGGPPACSSMSWHCLFAGYGTFPPQPKTVPLPLGVQAPDPASTTAMLSACAENFTR